MIRFQSWRNWPEAHAALRDRFTDDALAFLSDAYRFAREHHGSQTRPGGEPYVWHLLEAVEVAIELAGVDDPDVLVATLLHDVVEDTPCTLDAVEERFGSRVAELVGWVTKPESESGSDKAAIRASYLARFNSAPLDARVVKLADRYSNVQCLETHPRMEKQRSYYTETCEHFLPLAMEVSAFAEPYSQWKKAYAYLAVDAATGPEKRV